MASREEALLQNILGAENELGVPKSRIEKIWQYALGADGVQIEPAKSRIEALAIQVAEQVRNGGGGITPEGSITLTDNGTYDVADYANAIVDVPGITPAGSLSITANDTYDVTQYASAVVNVPSSGGIDSILDGSISGNVSSNVTSLRTDAFAYCALSSFTLPNITTIPPSAFYYSGLTQVNSSTDCPRITKIETSAFNYCRSLVNADFSSRTLTIGNNAFSNCSSMKTAIFGNVNDLGTGAFMNDTSLEYVEFKNLSGSNSLKTNTFTGCSSLTTLVFKNTSVVPYLYSTSVFSNTPIAAGTGLIYITDSLVETMKTTTNWSTYAAQIKPLSELPTA